jgi:hypothetical protein
MRARDAVRPLIRCLDWVLANPRTEVLTGIVTVTVGVYFHRTGGIENLMSNVDNVLASGGLLYGSARWLRERRGIRPGGKARRVGREDRTPSH